MTPDLIKILLSKKESEELDFKIEQYHFYDCTNENKKELLKDILAFANAWKTNDAYIIIGAKEIQNGPAILVPISGHLKDNDVQQFINEKTNKPVKFLCGTLKVDGVNIDVIKIYQNQDRPIRLKKDFLGLKAETVYVRRGSSTVEAGSDELAEMGASRVQSLPSVPNIEFEFADPSKRKRLGQSIDVISILVVDPPPPPSISIDEIKHNPIYRSPIQEMVKSIEKQKAIMGHFREPILSSLRKPSSEEIKKYIKEVSLFNGIGFWLKNTGLVSASDVRVQIRGEKSDGIFVADEYSLPEKPCGLLDKIHQIKPRLLDVQVNNYDDCWIVSIHVGKIQPQAETWIEDLLYIGAKQSMACEVEAGIFADNLPSPIVYKMRIAIETKEKVFDESDFNL